MKNKLYLTTALIALISTPALALPKIIYKDMTQNNLTSRAIAPASYNNQLTEIVAKNPDLYQIVIHHFNDHNTFYLLSSKVWGLKKLTYNLQGEVTPNDTYEEKEPIVNAKCPDPTVEFLVISAYPGVGEVDAAIDLVSKAAEQKYKTMTILNGYANGVVYKDWLSCPHLKAVYSIGHGFNEGIIVGDGDIIKYSYFQNKRWQDAFKNTTVFINSCQVYNYPFGSQLRYGNALLESDYQNHPGPDTYQYLGGETNLLMRDSELASACLMVKAIQGEAIDYDNLKTCIGESDMHYQDFGISYPGKYL